MRAKSGRPAATRCRDRRSCLPVGGESWGVPGGTVCNRVGGPVQRGLFSPSGESSQGARSCAGLTFRQKPRFPEE